MGVPNHTAKPKFAPFTVWGACSRCNARVRYSTLKRERLTGLLVCTKSSGRSTRPCFDPWPAVYDFQAFPDKSIEPPPEPLPLRYNLDDIWGNGPIEGTTTTFANAPAAAPDDATRLAKLLTTVPYYANLGKSAAFMGPDAPLSAKVFNLQTIVPQDYDGTFIPSNSVRTVTPPNEATELANIMRADKDPPPPGYIFVVDENGNYVVDENGNYVIAGVTTPVHNTSDDVLISPPWAALIKV